MSTPTCALILRRSGHERLRCRERGSICAVGGGTPRPDSRNAVKISRLLVEGDP